MGPWSHQPPASLVVAYMLPSALLALAQVKLASGHADTHQAPSTREIQANQPRGYESTDSNCSQAHKKQALHRTCLIARHNPPQRPQECDCGRDHADGKKEQNSEDKTGQTLITVHEKHAPEALLFGEVLALPKAFPEQLPGLGHAVRGEDPHVLLGLADLCVDLALRSVHALLGNFALTSELCASPTAAEESARVVIPVAHAPHLAFSLLQGFRVYVLHQPVVFLSVCL
mmetsp:Transcript_25081/g.42957  ORF Transcript_25081/g.42957 Transcript_25081/m.42957 type:complete len:230 (-) Transcript_25081:366-1055(-)